MAIDAWRAAEWTQGTWLQPPACSSFKRVCFDARLAQAGELFVALPGAQRDGHAYLDQARERGVAAALVERAMDCALPQLLVANTRQALMQMASANRAQFDGLLCGITGSCGKTSTKSLLRLLLGGGGLVHATPGNWNNQIGVPITLLGLERSQHRYAVVEAGINQAGEMASLAAMIQGDVTIFTTIGAAHLAALADVETIAQEKAQLAIHARPHSPIIMPARLLQYPALAAMSERVLALCPVGAPRPPRTFGCIELAFDPATLGRTRLSFHDPKRGERFSYELPTFTRGMMENAALAILAARWMGRSSAEIARGLNSWQPDSYRGQWYRGTASRWYVDCYNANPQSMRDALEYFIDSVPANQRSYFVLGTLLELGTQSEAWHRSLMRGIRFGSLATFLLVGEPALTHAYREGLVAEGVSPSQILEFQATDACLSKLRSVAASIFLKGSRQHKLESLLPENAVLEPSSGSVK